jgi:hypothetical protein
VLLSCSNSDHSQRQSYCYKGSRLAAGIFSFQAKAARRGWLVRWCGCLKTRRRMHSDSLVLVASAFSNSAPHAAAYSGEEIGGRSLRTTTPPLSSSLGAIATFLRTTNQMDEWLTSTFGCLTCSRNRNPTKRPRQCVPWIRQGSVYLTVSYHMSTWPATLNHKIKSVTKGKG